MIIGRGKQAGLAAVLSGFAYLGCPSYAAAHLVTTGMGPVYDGIGHLLLTPEDLIPVLALAIFAGLRGTTAGRRALFILPVAWFAGGLVGLLLDGAVSPFIPAVSFLLLGGLVAADLRLDARKVTALALVLGLIHGFLNGAALKDGAGFLGLVGLLAVLFVIVALLSAFVLSLKRPWARIAVRVTGSWIFASGLLMLGWIIKGQG
jgi:hydrogenase/urease accessory protein HupE